MLLFKEICGGLSLSVVLTAAIFQSLLGYASSQSVTEGLDLFTSFQDIFTTEFPVNGSNATTPSRIPGGGMPPAFVPFWQYDAAVGVEQIGGTIMVILGVVGNAVSFYILNKKKMRAMPSSIYFRVVTFTDLWVILLGQVARHWTRALSSKDSVLSSVWYCRVWYLIVPTLTLYSNYTLMAVTVERTIAIAFPFKAMRMNNKRLAKIYLITSLILITMWYTYGFYFYEIAEFRRGPDIITDCIVIQSKDATFVGTVRPWLEFTLSSMIPGGTILIGNIIIISIVMKASKNAFTAGNTEKDIEKEKEKAKRVKSMIIMLLTISTAYILLTTPFRVAFIINTVYVAGTSGSAKRGADMRFLWAVAIFCFYMNHAINFILYSISGREFRAELVKLCYKCVGKKPPGRPKKSATDVSSRNISSAVTAETRIGEPNGNPVNGNANPT